MLFFSNEHDFIWFPLFDILWFHSALRLPQQFEPISILFPNPVLSSIGVQTGRLQFSYMSYLAWLFHSGGRRMKGFQWHTAWLLDLQAPDHATPNSCIPFTSSMVKYYWVDGKPYGQPTQGVHRYLHVFLQLSNLFRHLLFLLFASWGQKNRNCNSSQMKLAGPLAWSANMISFGRIKLLYKHTCGLRLSGLRYSKDQWVEP